MASPDRPHFAAPNPENCRTPLYALLFDDVRILPHVTLHRVRLLTQFILRGRTSPL